MAPFTFWKRDRTFIHQPVSLTYLQREIDLAPTFLVVVLEGHGVQLDDPTTSANDPFLHLKQKSCLYRNENDPFGHTSHAVAPSLSENSPGSHLLQALNPVS